MTPEVSGFADQSALVRPLDEEQARLVEILQDAGGQPVSFEQFRAHGIENPAMLAYELEIAGFPIAHVHRRQPGGPPVYVGIRLEGRWFDQQAAGERPPRRSPLAATAAAAMAGFKRSLAGAGGVAQAASARAARGASASAPAGRAREASAGRPSRARTGPGDSIRPSRRVLAGAAGALALVGLAIALASSSSPSPKHASRLLGAARAQPNAGAQGPGAAGGPQGARAHHRSGGPRAHSQGATSGTAAPMTRAEELQLGGHTLLEEGRYAAAIGELRGALRAGGQSVSNCAEPTTPSCLTYAHALYDLGRALALDHAPAAAHAVLTERLRIDNQRGLVEQQLNLTHRRHHSSAPTAPRHPQPHHHAGAPSGSPPPAPAEHPKTGGVAAPAPTADSGAPGGGSA